MPLPTQASIRAVAFAPALPATLQPVVVPCRASRGVRDGALKLSTYGSRSARVPGREHKRPRCAELRPALACKSGSPRSVAVAHPFEGPEVLGVDRYQVLRWA